jgi:hypothetical protein
LGIAPCDSLAALLPEGPDEATARMATESLNARFVPLPVKGSRETYAARFAEIRPRLVLLHPGPSPARDAARDGGIAVADVLRHFEAGIFTLEKDLIATAPAAPKMPLVLIASGEAYRRLSALLDPQHPVVGITPPRLELLPPPHTIEHVAAECVRMLRRYRAHGPYALAGSRTEALVALETARLLEEEGEKVAFVAMMEASGIFGTRPGWLGRLFARRRAAGQEPLTEALRQYHPHPWPGKIIQVASDPKPQSAPFEWDKIAPHGMTSHFAPPEMLAEPNVRIVAAILATEMERVLAE